MPALPVLAMRFPDLSRTAPAAFPIEVPTSPPSLPPKKWQLGGNSRASYAFYAFYAFYAGLHNPLEYL